MGNIRDIIAKQKKAATAESGGSRKREFKVIMVHYSKLRPSTDNFYSVEEIEELADMLELSGEIKQNLLIKKVDAGEYEVIAGHKRRLAAICCVEERGNKNFEFLPCKEEDEDDLLNRFNLIVTNSTQRERSDYEKMREVAELKEIIPQILCDEELKGRALRTVIAKEMGLSEGTVATYSHIDNKLIPEGKERFKTGDIGVTVANELAGLPEEKQEELLERGEQLTIDEVKAAKKDKELNETEITAFAELLGRNEKVIDALYYSHSRADKISGLKNVYGNTGGCGRNPEYHYRFSMDRAEVKVEAYKNRVFSWGELVDIAEDLMVRGLLTTKLSMQQLSAHEEILLINAIKESIEPYPFMVDLKQFVSDMQQVATEGKVEVLQNAIFHKRRSHNETVTRNPEHIKVRFEGNGFTDPRIFIYSKDDDMEPRRIITWETAVNLVLKGIEREWIKPVSEYDTKVTPVNEDDCEGQLAVEDYPEVRPNGYLDRTIYEYLKMAELPEITTWFNDVFMCPPNLDSDKCIKSDDDENQHKCYECWKCWLLSSTDKQEEKENDN